MGLEKKLKLNNPELKKHTATIHCSNTLSLLQRKISNALLYHAYKELLSTEEHEITIKELCKLIAYQGNNHAAIKEALKGLLSTVIEWNIISDTTGMEDWTASSILASVSLKGPLCLYAYSPRMKQLLHSPTMFGKINLFIQSRFKSSYGLALYENCIRYRGLGFTKWFDIDIFRKLMGVPPDIYTVFRDFKRRVLDKSVQEVNTYSDLLVEAELWREGRAVVKIRFSLRERAKKVRLGHPGQEEDSSNTKECDLTSRIKKEYGLSSEQAERLIKEYGESFILEKIKMIEASDSFQKGKVQNVAAYFLSALKYDYQPTKPSVNKIAEQHQRALEQSLELKKREGQIKEIRKAYSSYREQMIDQAIQQLNAPEYAHFIADFRDYAADSIRTVIKLQRHKYTEETVLQSPQIMVLLRQFAFTMLPDLSSEILSIEEFVEDLPEQSRMVWREFSMVES